MPNSLSKKGRLTGFLFVSVLLLAGCTSFTGITNPRYDGERVVPDDEAIEAHQTEARVDSDMEEWYLRYSLSESLSEPSLDFTGDETLELTDEELVIGEDMPAGRAVLQGEPSDFRPEQRIFHTANVTITDENDAVVFEQHFQDDVGVMQAVVDLREGHTFRMTGNDPILHVSYDEANAPELTQAEASSDAIALIAGHYEVGNQIEAGTYVLAGFLSPRASELFVFSGNESPKIIDLHARLSQHQLISEEDNQAMLDSGQLTESEYEQNEEERERARANRPTLTLEEGDTLYLPMVSRLLLEKN